MRRVIVNEFMGGGKGVFRDEACSGRCSSTAWSRRRARSWTVARRPRWDGMAKLIYSAIASLDGYVADEDGNFDWAEPDEEVHAFVNDLERPVGTYLYGRRMYEVMVSWETLDARRPAAVIARLRRDLAGGRQDRVLEDAGRRSPARGRGSSGTSTPTRSGS